MRNGALVMPAIGASTTGGDTTYGPMRSAVALAGVVVVAAGVTPPLSQGQHRADESGASAAASAECDPDDPVVARAR